MVGTKHRLSELEENIPESQHLLTKKQRKGKNVEERDFHDEEEQQVSSEMEYEEEGDEDEIDPELVAGPGSIESVELFNFMCHKRLSTKFGKNINFLTGPNGSGKSAVLTALAVALGGKTTFTNRGSSLSSLIKEGEEVGEIIVRIRNTGMMAYKPDVYGDTIQIVRTMSRNGSGGYKIKSKKNQVISSRKADLMKILDHFQIAVDNPMTILTQDTARLFLANSTSGQKYDFFMKGTDLSALGKRLSELNEHIEGITDSVQRKEEHLPEMREEVKELQKKWEDMEAAAKHEETLNRLQGELVWSKLTDVEEKKNEWEEKMTMHEEKHRDSERKLRNEEAKLAQYEEQLSGIRDREKAAMDAATPIEASIRVKRQSVNDAYRLVRVADEEIKGLQREIQEAHDEAANAQLALDQERQKHTVDQKELEDVRNQQINQYQESIQEQQDRHDQASADLRNADRMIAEKTEEVNQISEKGKSLQSEVGRLRVIAESYENMRRNKLSGYGRNVSRVMEEITKCTNERKWRGQPPIGPFGLHIQLKKKECRSVVESSLNHLLNGFGVDNIEDQRLLNKILQKHNCPNTVYKYQAVRNFDFRSGLPERSLETILDVIEVNNEIVLQQLVIHSKVESTVLVPSHAEGDRITKFNTYIPPRVTKICTYDCFEVASAQGGRSTTMMNRYDGPTRFVDNIERELEDNRKQTVAKEKALQDVKAAHSRLKSDIELLQRDRRSFMSKFQSIEGEIQRLKCRIQNLQQSAEEQDPTNVPHYERLFAEAQGRVEVMQRQMPDLVAKHAQNGESYEALKLEYESLKADHVQEKASVDSIRSEKDALNRKRAQIDSQISHYRRKCQQHETEFKDSRKLYERAQEVFEDQEQQCLRFCDRIPTKRTESEIRSEIRKLEALVKQAEEEFGSREEFSKKFHAKYDALVLVEEEVKNFQDTTFMLKNAFTKRSKAMATFTQSVTTRCKQLFGLFVHKRGYRGMLDINHETKNLFLRVDVDNVANDDDSGDEDIDDRDPKTLSGGEKSYAQICLLLALWSSMYTPFRCLDEFDVFMDAVNRRLAVKLLIDYARSDGNASQFLLISPQNTAHLKELSGPDIQVLKMNPPERGQSTLDQFQRRPAAAASD